MNECERADWNGLSWSEWYPLVNALELDVPASPGLYRLRHCSEGRNGLEYIGESGDIRRRINSLRRGTFAGEMPFRDPHTAAPCMWAIRDAHGSDIEVSFTAPERCADGQTRKAIETGLIATHRREVGQSPTANFGRIIEGYRQSGYRRTKRRGGPLASGEQEPQAISGVGPLEWTSAVAVHESGWMSLEWSPPHRLAERTDASPPKIGLYRIWFEEALPPLAYIGESANIPSRLYKHQKTFGSDALFSCVARPELELAHRRQEIETELIGAHFIQTSRSPLAQFGYKERLPEMV